jgi:hypothetical protein
MPTLGSTTVAVGATAKTTMELLLIMRVLKKEIDKVTCLIDYTQSHSLGIKLHMPFLYP